MRLLTPYAWPARIRLLIPIIIFLGALGGLVLAPRMPLGPDYHDFADKRAILGIPNAIDVLSNIPFVIVGVWGLIWLTRNSTPRQFADSRERAPYLVFFAGVALTGIGSYLYHMAPSNRRLPWDLLPMTCSFMSIVVATYMERVNVRIGFAALTPMLLLGMLSVVYWSFTSGQGHGDYKFYLFVQFFSPVILLLVGGLFPPRYTGIRYLVIAFGLYVAAKLFEMGDYAIYDRFGRAISGHGIKHVTAALSCCCILRMLQVRRVCVRRMHTAELPTCDETLQIVTR